MTENERTFIELLRAHPELIERAMALVVDEMKKTSALSQSSE